VTGLYWLTAAPERYPGAPGQWSSDDQGAKVVLGDGEVLTVDGASIDGEYNFGVIAERKGRTAYFDDAAVEVAKRCGRDILRPRHPDHALRAGFSGVPTYGPDPRWALSGRYRAFEAPRPTTVGSVVEGLEHVYEAPGQVEFEVDGETYRLTAFNGAKPGSLMVLFTDATSDVTTYAANRTLTVGPPDRTGHVVVDFNRAVNLAVRLHEFRHLSAAPEGEQVAIGR
jgi:hypothetical protein